MSSNVQSLKYLKIASLTLLLVVVVVGVTWFMRSLDPNANVSPSGVTDHSEPGEIESSDNNDKQRTIATEWQWETFPNSRPGARDQDVAPSESTAPFDVTVIYEALQLVRVDENDDVVLDDTALKALNETLDYSDIALNAAELEELQELIRIGLPGKAGEQTARVVGDYYRFLGAKEEFEAVYEVQGDRHHESEYEELVSLRELYLGREVAQQLFAEEDKDARYMLAAMQLEADDSLTQEERSRQIRELAAQRDQTNDSPNWDRRYAAFEQQKQYIVDAGLSETEQAKQIEQLLAEHFSGEELATAKALETESPDDKQEPSEQKDEAQIE